MTNKDCVRRLQREYQKLLKEPTDEFVALPNPENILEWHFLIDGPEGTPYQGGTYHGKLKFPDQYPHKPPSIMMVTPSGRFIPETRLCLSYSDFHPETWNPMWNVSTILTGLISFMTSNEESVGTVVTSDSVKRVYAKASMEFNLKNATFRKFFESRCPSETSSSAPQATSSASDSAPSSTPQTAPQVASSSDGTKRRTGTEKKAQATAKVVPANPNPPDANNANPPTQQPAQVQVAAQVQPSNPSKSNPSIIVAIMFIVAGLAIYLNRML